MLQFIIPSIVIAVAVITHKLMLHIAERKRIRKMIREAHKEWESQEATTEYHDTNYKPIWPRKAV